jgi:uncharacterized protein YggE
VKRTFGRLAPALVVLAACGGQGARAQSPAPTHDADLARAYVYEVAPEQVPGQDSAGFIEVSAESSVSVAPDRVRASFAVENQAPAAEAAAAANADAMARVGAALRGAGVPGLRVETFGYTLRPDYGFPTVDGVRTRVIDGYTALNNVVVTADDIEAAGRIIDLAIAAGANRVSSLAFEATDTDEARQEALAQAVEQARGEAETIARALGHELGAPIEVRGGARVPRRSGGPAMLAEAASLRVETPIEVSDQTVTASVTIRFLLGHRVEGR